ncbi:MAG TPA: hypothetical protein VGW98_09070 [Solirubrobacteraceae bacterium]|jgi:hypothetical protein|nr:hypothetical protein [Solirubrobacteraceae bacterium]
MSRDTSCRTPSVGERVELARYTLTSGQRILHGRRTNGVVRVTDRPADGLGRSYLVEHALKDAYLELEALVADYTDKAKRLDEIPMAAGLALRIDQVELARYTLTGRERILYGQRINGVVRVTDRPANGPGRSYLVECGLEQEGYSALEALLADYIRQAHKLDEIPMATSVARRIHTYQSAPRRGGHRPLSRRPIDPERTPGIEPYTRSPP